MLEIKNNNSGKDSIQLVRNTTLSVEVRINNEIVARFYDDGRFEFYGQQDETQAKGRWKE